MKQCFNRSTVQICFVQRGDLRLGTSHRTWRTVDFREGVERTSGLHEGALGQQMRCPVPDTEG